MPRPAKPARHAASVASRSPRRRIECTAFLAAGHGPAAAGKEFPSMAKPASAEQKAATAAQRVIEQGLEREKAQRAKAQLGGLWSRRDVFGRFAWSIFGVFSGISLLAALRSAFPRVLFQPPTSFKAGLPTDFTIG